MKYSSPYYKRGQVMLTAVIFFLAISTTIILGVATPILKQVKISQENYKSKASYFVAEAALEDVAYRLKNGKTVDATEILNLNGGTATLEITNTANGKRIIATGNIDNDIRKMQADLTQSTGIAFNYGLQAGDGGVTINGGSNVDGNIYSNGNINAVSATITGTAVAADSAALAADQTNQTPATPPSSVIFRNISASRDVAQSFEVTSTSPLNKVQFYIKKVGAPANATVKIIADNNGSPSTTVIPTGTATLNAGQITTNYGWVEVVFATPVSLIPNTTYWVIIQNGTQNTNNYFVLGANSTTASLAKTGTFNGTWSSTNLNGYFKVYLGGTASFIGGASYSTGFTVGNSSTRIGDAWASTVKGTTAYGTIYCTTGLNNNKSCNTSKGIPPQQPLPFSEANIQSWRDEAEAGGTISGNMTIGYQGASLGSKKITGNLIVNGGGTLTLTGPLWVQGTVTFTAGGKVKLQTNYGKSSETIISDDVITISGGGSAGSGTAGSYLFLVSTSLCPNDVGCSGNSAINITGGAGAIAANAQYGNVALSGGAAISGVVGNSISITGGSTVTYDTGLASPSFVSGPAGGYAISNWIEVQ